MTVTRKLRPQLINISWNQTVRHWLDYFPYRNINGQRTINERDMFWPHDVYIKLWVSKQTFQRNLEQMRLLAF